MNPPWRVGDVVAGQYEVTRVHEHGGMGLVYRVRHLAWETDLALKRPRPEMFASPADRDRFAAEAETWVSLGLHPHLCSCHYVRLLDGVPCVFAEYVPGGSLAEWIDDGRLYEGGPDEAARRVLDLALQIAWGLRHAHDRGIVHQDVKPANVLLDHDGTAKVTDFGLARARAVAAVPPVVGDGTVSLRVSNGGLTPAYASPEQAGGGALGRRTDVYSFAVSVLEMFTGGRMWLVGPAAGEALAAYRAEGPVRTGPPPMPDGLAALLERCLRDDPARRPESMAEVIAALTAVYGATAGGDPRPEPVAAELRADELNNRALSLLDLGRPGEAERAFAQALAADPRHLEATYNTGLRRWRQGAISDEDLVAELETVRADTGDRWQARHLLAQIHLERGDDGSAAALLDGIESERPGEPEIRETLRAVRPGRTAAAPAYSGDRPLSPLPVRLAADARVAVTGEYRGAVRVWDLRDGRCRLALDGHEGAVHAVDVTPDGRFAASAGADGTIAFWDLTEGRRVGSAPAKAGTVRLTPDGRRALWALPDGGIQLWDIGAGRAAAALGGHSAGAERIEVGPGGHRALSSGWDREGATVRLWNLEDGTCLRVLTGHGPSVTAMCFARDGATAVIAGRKRAPVLWDLGSGRRIRSLTGGGADYLSLSADARFLLAGDDFAGTVRLWDLDTGCCLRTHRGERGRVNAVLLAADGRSGLAVSADEDALVRTWELAPPGDHPAAPRLARPRPHTELTRLGRRVAAMVAEAERELAAGRLAAALGLLERARTTPGHERAPRVLAAWRELGRRATRTGLRAAWSPGTLAGHADQTRAVDVSGDGRVAVSAGDRAAIAVWDVESGTRTAELRGHRSEVRSVCLSPDGTRVLSAGRDGVVRHWRADTGACLRVLPVNHRPSLPAPVRFTADGRTAVVGGGDGTVRLWDLDTGGEARVLTGHDGAVNALWVEGGLLASGGADGTVRLWDLATGRGGHVFEGHTGGVQSVCVSAGGARVVSSGGDYDWSIRVWDATTGEQVREVIARPGSHTVRMTGDGRFVVSAGHHAFARVWDAATGECVRTLGGHEKGTSCLALTPDGRRALTGEPGGTLRTWELDWELSE
ncbi:protein kinase domain-containing protein [Spirillospora sp. CA-294931]|uniref:protein kinase domain-containing protein n=1 Tax=Spirillospora sp. CA-294931 TaxID=3240042 RepID=UPI003D94E8D3